VFAEWRKAIDLWNAVLAASPGDAEALNGIQQAQSALDQGSQLSTVEAGSFGKQG
jgi:hypothetical protein